jgi:tRNA threonylcarbamoyladenosine biosynthesis protein TsaB
VFLVALDTCDRNGSVALLRDGQVLCVAPHSTSEDYSSWLLPAVRDLLTPARLALADLHAYAVAAGPGSFTGVRVGLTTVKAWSEVYNRGIAVVSRLHAIAAQASANVPYVAAFADARRGQVFGALYSRGSNGLERIGDEMVIAPGKFLTFATQTAGSDPILWISPDPQSLVETQDWLARRNLGDNIEKASPVLAPLIGQLGYQLALDNRLTDALALDANYVRRSDAEIFWQERRFP